MKLREENNELKEKIKIGEPYFVIPREIYFDEDLTIQDGFVFHLIRMLCAGDNNKCWASNNWFSDQLLIHEKSVTRSIRRLKKNGYITQAGFNGRFRLLQCNVVYKSKDKPAGNPRSNPRTYSDLTRPLPRREVVEEKIVEEENPSFHKNEKKDIFENPKTDFQSSSKSLILRHKHQRSKQSLTIKSFENSLPKVPPSILTVINKWQGLGLRKHNPNKQVYKDVVKCIKRLREGRFFDDKDNEFEKYKRKKFTQSDLITSIQRFSWAATNFDYEPINKEYKRRLRNISMADFFYNPYAKYNSSHKSLFIYYLYNRPKTLSETVYPIQDDYPKITNVFKRDYVKKVYGGMEVKFTQTDENKFIRASKRMSEFLENNLKKIRLSFRETYKRYPTRFVDVVLSALIDHYGEEEVRKFGIGCLYSDNTYSKVLPGYLHSEAIVDDGRFIC